MVVDPRYNRLPVVLSSVVVLCPCPVHVVFSLSFVLCVVLVLLCCVVCYFRCPRELDLVVRA